MTWRPIRLVVMPMVVAGRVREAPTANTNAEPHVFHRMSTREFLEMLDPGRHYPDLDMPSKNEPDPAA